MKKGFSIFMAFAILVCGVSGVWEEKIQAITKYPEKNQSISEFEKNPIAGSDKEENYVVVVESEEHINTLEKNYNVVDTSEYEKPLAAEKNMLSISMTGDEARELQSKKDVLLVERDTLMKACSRGNRKIEVRKNNSKNRKKGEWNLQAIKVNVNRTHSTEAKKKVKVAVLDSGVDYDNDIEIAESINLVPGEEDMSPLFVDDTGHGTGVAGIVAAKDNGKGITGINDRVELYSARILSNDTAPISRVVEGIYWAIEKHVNIINISFSTPENSQLLSKAIQDAYDAGILIVAAAGNDKQVEYPAAYDEVIAVGSVDYEGNKSDASASGEKLELVAPGEKVMCSALLGGTVAASGTSLSAPHVTAVASLLWEKDLSVSHEFIRGLLNASANGYGDKNKYGNGLVDYQYALKIYDDYKKEYDDVHRLIETDTDKPAVDTETTEIPANESSRIVFDENNYVEGRWAGHGDTVAEYTTVKNFQYGAKAPDTMDGLKGLSANHAWHGGRFCNFVANYRYLNKVARAVNDLAEGASVNTIKDKIKNVAQVKGMNCLEYGNMESSSQSKYADGIYEGLKRDLCTYIAPELQGKTKRQKEAYVFGLASHVATDAFAHASYRYNGYKWNYIKHEKTKNKDGVEVFNPRHPLYADRTGCVKRRFASAKAVLQNIVSRFENERSSVDIIHDFAIDSAWVDGTRRKYYNTYFIKYTIDADNDNATYRIYHFADYMLTAGETNGDMLNMYSLASEYPGNILK